MEATRENGYIAIRLSEEIIIKNAPCKVTDSEEFLNFITSQICDFGDDGDFNSCSMLTEVIDAIVEEAIETGAGAGVEEL